MSSDLRNLIRREYFSQDGPVLKRLNTYDSIQNVSNKIRIKYVKIEKQIYNDMRTIINDMKIDEINNIIKQDKRILMNSIKN